MSARAVLPWVFGVLAVVGVGVTIRAILTQVTWYLAVDQFGYLQFAHDLLQGRVIHEWEPARLLFQHMPLKTDVLVQTYIWDRGRMYCRYAPGFPLVLASWIGLFGDERAHYLNPTLFGLFMVVILVLVWRLGRSRWSGLAAAVSVPLYASYMYFWSLTLTRDLAAHLFAFIGLLVLAPNRRPLAAPRVAGSMLALGFAGSIRPDALVYLLPAGLLVLTRWRREAHPRVVPSLAAGALGLLVGLFPAGAYNLVAVGNPLTPTQGMELKNFLPTPTPEATTEGELKVGFPPGGWRGGTVSSVQGGGLRLENFARVFPGNLRNLQNAYGPVLLGLAVWGAVVAMFASPALFVVAVPYTAVAMFLYSCWARPDNRYLMGVHVFVPILIVEGISGTLGLARQLALRGRPELSRAIAGGAAVLLGLAALLVAIPEGKTAVPILTNVIATIGALAMGLAAMWPKRRIAAVALPILALALVGVAETRWRTIGTRRAPYQEGEVQRAQAAFRKVVEPNSIVITSEDIGRPAENIEYYSGVAQALYLTDLERWKIDIETIAFRYLTNGKAVYLMIPRNQRGREALFAKLPAEKGWIVDRVLQIEPQQNYDYFIAAPFHRGVAVELWRIRSLPSETYFKSIGGRPMKPTATP